MRLSFLIYIMEILVIMAPHKVVVKAYENKHGEQSLGIVLAKMYPINHDCN